MTSLIIGGKVTSILPFLIRFRKEFPNLTLTLPFPFNITSVVPSPTIVYILSKILSCFTNSPIVYILNHPSSAATLASKLDTLEAKV